MPNWASNAIVITGPKEELDKIKEIVEEGFSLQKFLPMPAALEGISSGGITIDGESHRFWRYVHKETGEQVFDKDWNDWRDADGREVDREDIEPQAIPEEEQERLKAEHGAINWYGWNVKNWGCKWDVGEPRHEVDEDAVKIWFDTPWSPPDVALMKISEMFPTLTIHSHYAEQGCGCMGTVVYKEGDAEEVFAYSGCFYEEDCDEDDLRYTPKVEVFLTEHGLHAGG